MAGYGFSLSQPARSTSPLSLYRPSPARLLRSPSKSAPKAQLSPRTQSGFVGKNAFCAVASIARPAHAEGRRASFALPSNPGTLVTRSLSLTSPELAPIHAQPRTIPGASTRTRPKSKDAA